MILTINVLAGLTILLISLLLYKLHKAATTPKVKVKHPKPHPFWGNLFMVLNNHQGHDTVVENLERCGDPYTLLLPGGPAYVGTANPDNIQHILKDRFDIYEKGFVFDDSLREFLGHGIFNADGESWKIQRKLASHLFTAKNFKTLFGEIFHEKTNNLINILDKAAVENKPIAISNLFYNLTMDVFGSFGLGIDFNCLKDADGMASVFANAFDQVQKITTFRFSNPVWKISEFLNGDYFKFKKCMAQINEFTKTIINSKKQQIKSGDEPLDLLDFFINHYQEEVTDAQLRDISLNFILAGRDTTAQALSWSIFLLCLHPNVYEKMREESIRVLGKDLASYETIKDLKYTQAVFYEVLRLYPSVPMNMKMNKEPDTLPDGTFVPKSSMILYSAYAMGRSTKLWGSDASEFRPERWFDEEGNLKKEGNFKWPAFHGGPRICLGQQLATSEAVTILSLFSQRYRFELVPGQEITYAMALTLPMKHPLQVLVTRA